MPPPRRSKRLRTVSVEPPTPSNVCYVCKIWGDEPDGGACDECPHAFHDACIPEEFRGRQYDTCADLGFECCPDEPAIYFKFGKKIDAIISKSRAQKKAFKKRSCRSSNKRKRRTSTIGGSAAVTKKEFVSFNYNHVEYKKGDDVVVAMSSQEGGWGIARITKITQCDRDRIPLVKVIWFWRATELSGSRVEDVPRGTPVDIQNHELHLDDNCPGEIFIDTLFENELSSKALVVSSSEEYIQNLNEGVDKSKYFDVYWCSHAYNQNTGKKSLMPTNAIRAKQTVGITPVKANGKSRKRDRKTMIEQALSDASKALMLSSVPKTLPCREKENKEVKRYMENQISSQGYGSGLYISGMPGTGKTATVRQIAGELKKLTAKRRGRGKSKRLPEFDYFEINAMKLPTPRHIYTELAKQLMDKHVEYLFFEFDFNDGNVLMTYYEMQYAPNTAVKKLEQYFNTKSKTRRVCVLLVDELDYLLTRQQKVIYNLFDWPTKANAKLVVIGIANTMDLPERLLPRVASRMGTARVVFKAYQREQLQKIIEHRLKATKVFSTDAIRFCASAVAGVSGDCRTALQICRRAVEIVQRELQENGIDHLLPADSHNNKRAKTQRGSRLEDVESSEGGEQVVSLVHLKKAKDSFDQSNDVQIVSTLSIYEKLFLTAMVMHNARNDGLAARTDKYRQKFDMMVVNRLGESKMRRTHFKNMLDRLQDMGIIHVAFEKKEWEEFVGLEIQAGEAAHALKENDICAKVLSALMV